MIDVAFFLINIKQTQNITITSIGSWFRGKYANKQMVMCNQMNEEKKKREEKMGKYNPIESYLNKFPSASVEEKKNTKTHTHT